MHRHWVGVGAAVIVILLSFEPFIQAIIDHSGSEGLSPDQKGVAIGSSTSVNVGFIDFQGTAVQAYPFPYPYNETLGDCRVVVSQDVTKPDLAMVAAVYDGFSNSTSTEDAFPAFSCPSGNCTWSAYSSLAVCSECHDVSSHLTTSRHSGYSGSFYRQAGDMLTYLLPYNNITNFIKLNSSNSYINRTLTAQATIDNWKTISFQNHTTFLLAFSILTAPQEYRDGLISWGAQLPIATECGLYLCAKIYNSTVTEGILSETELGSYVHRDLDSMRATTSDGCNPALKVWDQLNNYTLYAPPCPRADMQLYLEDSEAALHAWPLPPPAASTSRSPPWTAPSAGWATLSPPTNWCGTGPTTQATWTCRRTGATGRNRPW